MVRRRSAVLACILLILAVTPGAAEEPVTLVDTAATATGVAVRVVIPSRHDLVSVSQVGMVGTSVIAATERAAAVAGAKTAPLRGFSVGMTAVRRADRYVQIAGAGTGVWQFPMSTTVLPGEALTVVMGPQVASAVAEGQVVMGRRTADLRGALEGDVVDLVAVDGSVVSFTIGLIADDTVVGGTEIVMSPEQADLLGKVQLTSVLVYAAFDRDRLEAALRAEGLVDA